MEQDAVGVSGSAWWPLGAVAADLGVRVDLARITAETDLGPDVYDPGSDMVSERGRRQLHEQLEALEPAGFELVAGTLPQQTR